MMLVNDLDMITSEVMKDGGNYVFYTTFFRDFEAVFEIATYMNTDGQMWHETTEKYKEFKYAKDYPLAINHPDFIISLQEARILIPFLHQIEELPFVEISNVEYSDNQRIKEIQFDIEELELHVFYQIEESRHFIFLEYGDNQFEISQKALDQRVYKALKKHQSLRLRLLHT